MEMKCPRDADAQKRKPCWQMVLVFRVQVNVHQIAFMIHMLVTSYAIVASIKQMEEMAHVLVRKPCASPNRIYTSAHLIMPATFCVSDNDSTACIL